MSHKHDPRVLFEHIIQAASPRESIALGEREGAIKRRRQQETFCLGGFKFEDAASIAAAFDLCGRSHVYVFAMTRSGLPVLAVSRWIVSVEVAPAWLSTARGKS